MDSVWSMVRANPTELVPCVKAALEERRTDTFFQFDGSMLLISVDSSPDAKRLQVAALEHTDPRDVQAADWVNAVASRALDGFDTRRIAAKWFDLPDSLARYFLPEHGAAQISKSDAALILYGALPESLATPALSELVTRLTGSEREVALALLMAQETPEARRAVAAAAPSVISPGAQLAIAAYLKGPSAKLAAVPAPRVRRDEFLQAFRALEQRDPAPFLALVQRVPNGENDAAAVLLADDLPAVRFARRYFVSRGTPEAIGYYGDFTNIIETVLARAPQRHD